MEQSLNHKYSVSVIMPTYNQENYILDSIESVMQQSYPIYELIVIDNYSDDGTERLVESIKDKRLRYYKYNNSGIIASSRNFGVKKATGNVIAFIDSDDIWVLNKIEHQLLYIDEPDVKAIATDFFPMGNVQACRRHIHIDNSKKYKDYVYASIIEANPIMTSSVLMKKMIFDEISGFDEDIAFRYIEDWELWVRVAMNGVIRILNENLVGYRINNNENRDYSDVAKRTKNIVSKNYNQKKIGLIRYLQLLANCDVNIGKAYLNINDYRGIIHYFKGLLFSTNLKYRVRSIQGLILFIIPKRKRKKLIKIFGRIYNKYNREIQ